MTTAAQTRAPLTFPAQEELDAALEEMRAAIETMTHLRWRVWQLADWEDMRRVPGDEVPTIEHVGRFYSFWIEARSDVEELEMNVKDLGKFVRDIDHVRVNEEGKRGDRERKAREARPLKGRDDG